MLERLSVVAVALSSALFFQACSSKPDEKAAPETRTASSAREVSSSSAARSAASSAASTAASAAQASATPVASASVSAAPAPASSSPPLLDARWSNDGVLLAVRGTKLSMFSPKGGTTSFQIAANPRGAAWSPLGHFVLLPYEDGHVDVVSTSNGQRAGGAPAPAGYASYMTTMGALSTDGSVMVVSTDRARIIEVATGATRCEGPADYAAFDLRFVDNDSAVVLVTSGHYTRIDAKTCKVLDDGTSSTGGTFVTLSSPDGKWVASSADDGHALELNATMPFKTKAVLAHAKDCQEHIGAWFSHDGSVLLSSGGFVWVKTFEVPSMKPIADYRLDPHGTYDSVDLTDDGKHAVIRSGEKLSVIDLATKKQLCSFEEKGVSWIASSPDSKLIAVILEASVHVRDVATCADVATVAM